MRPSFDAEHPHSTTPIYDELYSEYRRLFRALPGDRSGEENMKFTGFAVRDGYPVLADPRPYPQQQAFQSYGGQALGLPQFMPNQQTGPGVTGPAGHTSDGTGHAHTTGQTSQTSQVGQTGHLGQASQGQAGQPAHSGQHPQSGHGGQPAPAAQFANGQGWVAAGYLGPVPHPMPTPAPGPGATTGGRHRNLLSLPPGRSTDQH
ncbi:hypothetical protein ACFVVX_26685 [Kitasatospora sp. NPDC058170]|uniref:hypothetical protein n=1 Tax=Kitasatospora sp. NPDC058170 TaxID=3346364 RepID=UPI0036D7F27A